MKLRMGESGPAAETPLTVNQLFARTVERFGDRTALGWKEGEQMKKITYRDYYRECRAAAKSFLKVRMEECVKKKPHTTFMRWMDIVPVSELCL